MSQAGLKRRGRSISGSHPRGGAMGRARTVPFSDPGQRAQLMCETERQSWISRCLGSQGMIWGLFCVTENVLRVLHGISLRADDTSMVAFVRGDYRSTKHMRVPERRAYAALGQDVSPLTLYSEWGSRVCAVCPSAAQEKWGSHGEGQRCGSLSRALQSCRGLLGC